MSNLMQLVWNARQARTKRGASALEYALLVVILVVGLVLFFKQFGDRVSTNAKKSSNTIKTQMEATSQGQPWNNP